MSSITSWILSCEQQIVTEKICRENIKNCWFIIIIINIIYNTPGTAGGPGGRDRTLAVKIQKTQKNSAFFLKKIKIT